MPEIKYEINTNAGSTAVSYELLKKDTGFEPSVNLKQSVEEIVNSLMKNSEELIYEVWVNRAKLPTTFEPNEGII